MSIQSISIPVSGHATVREDARPARLRQPARRHQHPAMPGLTLAVAVGATVVVLLYDLLPPAPDAWLLLSGVLG